MAMMVSQFYGVPVSLCSMQGETLKNSKFSIRTGLGDSLEYYQHSKNTPDHGTGQGSCASPAIWLLISSFLMKILSTKANGMTLYDPIGIEDDLIKYIEGFVDDTSLFTNLEYNNDDLKQLIDRMETDGTVWSKLLEASGGKLEMEKCFYYILSWKWSKNGNPQPQIISEQSCNSQPICLERNKENPQYLKQMEINESHKTLGVLKTTMGIEDKHIQYLMEKSEKYTLKAQYGHMTRQQACIAYYSNYIPAMMYSIVATCLDETQLNKIQQKATTMFLRIIGYDMHFPRAVVYGPQTFGGLGLMVLYVEVSCRRVEVLICEWNNKKEYNVNHSFQCSSGNNP
jgi:hypothetical protein